MHTRRHTSIAILTAAALPALIGPTGCTPTSRVIAVRGGLQNIAGAEGGIRPEGGQGRTGQNLQSVTTRLYGSLPGEPVDGMVLRRKLENGDIVLISRSPSELIFHLRRTIRDEEWDLVYDQLLSEQLKDAYADQNLDPRQSVEFLQRHARSIVDMLAMIPSGDQTPGAAFQQTGRNTYRLTVPGGRGNEIRFTSMDLSYEGRQFKLRMLD